ncbi:MAG TPA: hypothetical protein VMX38_03125 [Verrucomicrobiae bacterium]|jgi:hypothetical protein|nr:hypothetical protein [Verrucomicrobiae bacterium]
MSELRRVELPADLCAQAERKFSKSFGSLEELLIAALRELCRDDSSVLNEAEQKMVEQRLRDLGYL